VMEAASVLIDDEKLRSLGARREFELPALLRLADLLMRRDASGRIRAILREGAERGGLALLRSGPTKGEGEPDDVARVRKEIVELLDPAVPLP